MISHKHRFIFQHVPKTGGCSIEAAFGIGMVFHNPEEPADRRHWKLRHYQKRCPEAYELYFKFSFVRNPWARLVSRFHGDILDSEQKMGRLREAIAQRQAEFEAQLAARGVQAQRLRREIKVARKAAELELRVHTIEVRLAGSGVRPENPGGLAVVAERTTHGFDDGTRNLRELNRPGDEDAAALYERLGDYRKALAKTTARLEEYSSTREAPVEPIRRLEVLEEEISQIRRQLRREQHLFERRMARVVHRHEGFVSRSFKEFVKNPRWARGVGGQLQSPKGDKPTADEFDFIGRFETLADDFAKVCAHLGVEATLSHVNKSNHRRYTDYYDDETRDIIARACADDIERFGYRFGD